MASRTRDFLGIVADVGGTHVRFGALADEEAPLHCIRVRDCAEFTRLDEAVSLYLDELSSLEQARVQPRYLCLALPGDVQSEPVNLVNLGWQVSPHSLAQQFGCQVLTLNDFTAQALAIPGFAPSELEWLRQPAVPTQGLTRAIIGPGTGFGVAALLPDGAVVESEAGHLSFAPQSPLQQEILARLWGVLPRISVERMLSGPGLAMLYRGMSLTQGRDMRLKPEEVTRQARAGDPLAIATIAEFNRILGAVCGDLALAFGAKGGVFLSGGLLGALFDLLDTDEFLQQFDNKGRYQDYCRQIPVARVLAPLPGLLGAARHLLLTAASK